MANVWLLITGDCISKESFSVRIPSMLFLNKPTVTARSVTNKDCVSFHPTAVTASHYQSFVTRVLSTVFNMGFTREY